MDRFRWTVHLTNTWTKSAQRNWWIHSRERGKGTEERSKKVWVFTYRYDKAQIISRTKLLGRGVSKKWFTVLQRLFVHPGPQITCYSFHMHIYVRTWSFRFVRDLLISLGIVVCHMYKRISRQLIEYIMRGVALSPSLFFLVFSLHLFAYCIFSGYGYIMHSHSCATFNRVQNAPYAMQFYH